MDCDLYWFLFSFTLATIGVPKVLQRTGIEHPVQFCLLSGSNIKKMMMMIVMLAAVTFGVEFSLIEWFSRAAVFLLVNLFVTTKIVVRYLINFGVMFLLLLCSIVTRWCNRTVFQYIYNILFSTLRSLQMLRLKKAWKSKLRTPKCGPFRVIKLKPKPKQIVGQVSMIAEITQVIAARGWFLDSGATIHVCGSRVLFKDYRAVTGKQVMMANRDRADVCGVGTVILKFTSGKRVILTNVLHVPTISKNLVSLSQLDVHDFKITFESRKVVVSKRKSFVGKGYFQGGMYRLNVETGNNLNLNLSLRSNTYHYASIVDVSNFEINEISVVYSACSISL